MTDATTRTDFFPVIIVGAGPVGISAALRLSALGINCALVEAGAEPGGDLRASTFHPPTLEMLATLGLTEALIKNGLKTPNWQIRMHDTGERALFDLSVLADDTPYPFRLQCEQATFCRLGLVMAKTDPAIEVMMSTSIATLSQDGDGVTLAASDGRVFRAA